MQFEPVVLSGREVRLEPLAIRHVAALAKHAANPEIWEHIAMEPLTDEETARAFVVRTGVEAEQGEALTFAVVSLRLGEAVGTTSYFMGSGRDRRIEIGRTWLSRAVWRTAINTECKWLLLRQAFETWDCLRVELITDARNLRSQTAIERLGAVREGVLRAHMRRRDGSQRDTVMYSIVAAEWPEVRARLEGMLRPKAG